MRKPPRPKLTNCSPTDIRRLLEKLGGFSFFEGRKHAKATHESTRSVWMTPRHAPLKRPYMQAVVKRYLVGGCGIAEAEIFRLLRC